MQILQQVLPQANRSEQVWIAETKDFRQLASHALIMAELLKGDVVRTVLATDEAAPE
jgi:hypothetical protein